MMKTLTTEKSPLSTAGFYHGLVHSLKAKYKRFFTRKEYPCIMAQTVFKLDNVEVKSYKEFGSEQAAQEIINDLVNFLTKVGTTTKNYHSFLAVFPSSNPSSEKEFEQLLWRQLQHIHNHDNRDWDPNVSDDPTDSNFSFSIAGKAFYIVGMHPGSSRKARRSPSVTIVFNLHHQFEQLREKNAFEKVKSKIRNRDRQFQGSVNPMLADFGDGSEAIQYSGRKVSSKWKCPFHRH